MKNLKTERKVIIEKQDYYDVSLVGDCTHHNVKTGIEAEKLKKELEEAEKQKVKECNDRELREIEANKIIRRELIEEMQKLVNIQRAEKMNTERVEMAKQFRARLKEIIESADKKADETIGYHGAY